MKLKITLLVFILIIALTDVLISLEKVYAGNGFYGNSKNNSFRINSEKVSDNYQRTELFVLKNKIGKNDNSNSFVSESVQLNLKKENLNQVIRNNSKDIILKIPVSENESMELLLSRSNPVSDDFSLLSKGEFGTKAEYFSDGLHYSGIIKGKNNSIAAISIFENFVMGIISDENGNYVLGSVKNPDNSYSDNYIFYNDRDLKILNKFKCGTDDYDRKFIRDLKIYDEVQDNTGSNDNVTTLPVKVYFEADYQTYLDNQSNLQLTANFISGMFNSVRVIYQNEAIPVVISSIGIWTVPDPYLNLSESFDILSAFGELTQNNFQGNLAHLISTRNEGLGGIAWIRVLCADYNPQDYSGRYAFSNIEPTFNNYPLYSWTVNVVAHEMGHNFGSKHTHACAWPTGPGNTIGSIDSCYYAEGNCFNDLRPRFGTIMSYCHLWFNNGGGVNLASGFGPLPGDTIRLRYNQASCLVRTLNSSEVPVAFDLDQNYPNPFNPETVIKFSLPKESYVTLKIYDIRGKEAAVVLSNSYYTPGFYSQKFNANDYSLSSGMYFYRLSVSVNNLSDDADAGDYSQVKKMVYVK